MNKIERNKKSLTILSLVAIFFGTLCLGGCVTAIIISALSLSSHLGASIAGIVIGSLLSIPSLGIIIFGVYYCIMARSITATKESIKEENLAKKE